MPIRTCIDVVEGARALRFSWRAHLHAWLISHLRMLASLCFIIVESLVAVINALHPFRLQGVRAQMPRATHVAIVLVFRGLRAPASLLPLLGSAVDRLSVVHVHY